VRNGHRGSQKRYWYILLLKGGASLGFCERCVSATDGGRWSVCGAPNPALQYQVKVNDQVENERVADYGLVMVTRLLSGSTTGLRLHQRHACACV